MQPELISLMQQLVTAVQSIALSVDVMSMDLRALNKNVIQLAKKDVKSDMSPLTVAPECIYSQDDETSPRVMPAPAAEHISGMEATSSYQSPDFQAEEAELNERYPRLRDSLREDIRKAMCKPTTGGGGGGGGTTPSWQKDCAKLGLMPKSGNVSSGGGGGWANNSSNAQMHFDSNDQSQGGDGHHQGEMAGDGPHTGEGSGVTPGGKAMGHVSANPVKGRKGRVFRCEWCGKEFPENYKLRNHIRIHTGERPFSCFQCGKAFAHKENLTVHTRVHSGDRPFPCDVCGKAFRHKENLVVHGRVHSGEKPFDCEVCGKAFARKEKLVAHRRIHTGEKPFACEMCGKAFKDSGNLSRHKRVHVGRGMFN